MKPEEYRDRLYKLWERSHEITNELYDLLLQLEEPPDGLCPKSVEEVYQWEYLRRIIKDRDPDTYCSLLGCNLWTMSEEDIQFEINYNRNYLVQDEERMNILLQYLQDGYILGTRKIREILGVAKSTAYNLLNKLMEFPMIEKTQNKNGTIELQWRKEHD